MNNQEEPRLPTRRTPEEHPHHPSAVAAALPPATPQPPRPSVLPRLAAITLATLIVLAVGAYFGARHYVRASIQDSLPQLDGTLAIPGLAAPVTVTRDPHGVPTLHAATIDDLVLAQGFVTAQDRLFQMDTFRRHAAGTLAEILGPAVLNHDRLQRTLQVRAAADRAIAQLPPDELHLLEQYSKGVNASIAQQSSHLPIEFKILRYTPDPWTPRDSILVTLAIFQDLTNAFPTKLARESLTARLPPDLAADLYPTGSWRDHPPATGLPDLTIPGPPVEQVPLDESQASLNNPGAPRLASETWDGTTTNPGAPSFRVSSERVGCSPDPANNPNCVTESTILASLAPLLTPHHPDLAPGSNNWAVSGAHTATGHPLLANDMHLTLTIPGIWYEANLIADEGSFHAAGVSIPGAPLIAVGHNAHLAWGVTNLGADVQDVYIETTRNNEEFQALDGTWQPLTHLPEPIKIKNRLTENFEVLATRHGSTLTPILNPVLTPDVLNHRTLTLRWTIYDPANLTFPWLAVNSAQDGPALLAAFANFGGPAQNLIYATADGHIGYHAIGLVPLRGPAQNPVADTDSLPSSIALPDAPENSETSPAIRKNLPAPTGIQAPATPTAPLLSGPLSGVPLVPTPAHEWSGYIPFDRLPQVLDPPAGVLATANARIAPDDYPYPITLNWAAPYRNERIWRALAGRTNLTPADMLALQTDIYSDLDHVLAQRLAYAIDHVQQPSARLVQAANLLRVFNGRMALDSPAASIVAATRDALWPMLLLPHLDQKPGAPLKPGAPSFPELHPGKGGVPSSTQPQTPALDPTRATTDLTNTIYLWQSRDYALEQILMHTPPRWLPAPYTSWDAFLASAVDRALVNSKAPTDLSQWTYAKIHLLDVEHPIFAQSPLLQRLAGLRTGTGPTPQSGDNTTVKQVGKSFGPSQRFTADLANPDASTMNLPFGQSANPASPWFLDQFPLWLKGTTLPFPFTNPPTTHTLTLTPRN